MNFLLNNKFWLVVVGGLLGVLLGLWLVNLKLNNEIKSLKEQNSQLSLNLVSKEANLQISNANLNECESRITLTNTKLKAISLDNDMLKKQAQKLQVKLERKYERIQTPAHNAKCESKLKFYENLFKELGDE
ncbi:hypothetical protein CCAL6883_09100 [Campylobacter sp. RM6883]|uniref:hypothetical protein n=1 Tax=Campylobacter californiensis TaxID=1032243 RepID=UPI0014527BED|nr:hypothetical protein [Campylobacter sp. RM6914]MBE2985485.1 hypothetical protein [Campylobacter sp. RM6883]MBE2995896.1 hypothetical protein [Campylobacter sp. RM6913]QCD51215.1 hypothetical protein CCAL_1330 [Campylobacter sp. RM6914]